MKYKFNFKRIGWSGETIGQTTTINLREVYSMHDVLEVIHHEHFHGVLNAIGESASSKKEHYIYKRLSVDFF